MGFLGGTLVWFLHALSLRFGLRGDAIMGIIVMHAFFLNCMFVFAPSMLLGETLGRGIMPLFGALIGLLLGEWIGHDLRRDPR